MYREREQNQRDSQLSTTFELEAEIAQQQLETRVRFLDGAVYNGLTGSELEEVEKEILKENQCMKKINVILFAFLAVVSIVGGVAVLYYWKTSNRANDLTNVFSAFMGFLVTASINVLTSAAGIVALFENDWEMNEPHSEAIATLLITGIILNIIAPTSALLPLESDSRTRIPKYSIYSCFDDTDPYLRDDPVCKDASKILSCIYFMYSLLILESAAVGTFSYIKFQQFHILPRIKVKALKTRQELEGFGSFATAKRRREEGAWMARNRRDDDDDDDDLDDDDRCNVVINENKIESSRFQRPVEIPLGSRTKDIDVAIPPQKRWKIKNINMLTSPESGFDF